MSRQLIANTKLPLKAVAVSCVCVSILLAGTVTAQEASESIADEKGAQQQWPPPWVEGAWKRGDFVVYEGGAKSTKTFAFAKYYIFISGHRFSVYSGSRVRATPIIGNSMTGDVNHCVLKRLDGRGRRAYFKRDDQLLQYVSYLQSGTVRYRLSRTLEPIKDREKFLTDLQRTLDAEFTSVESDDAREILETWIAEQRKLVQ